MKQTDKLIIACTALISSNIMAGRPIDSIVDLISAFCLLSMYLGFGISYAWVEIESWYETKKKETIKSSYESREIR